MYLVLLAVILLLVNMFGSGTRDTVTKLDYTDLLKLIEKDGVSQVMVMDNNVLIARSADSQIPASEFPNRYDIVTILNSADRFFSDANAIYAKRLGKSAEDISAVDYTFDVANKEPATTPWWMDWVPLLVTMGLFGAFWYFMMRQQTGAGKGGVMSFGKSRARLTDPSKNKVTFDDVAGADEEKEELREIVEFLKDPKRFTDVGARIPKGVLLVGPPGTGKTLLARAVSGEAGVPFFTISGSDFVEMFVGVGASRVRDLFEQAKRSAPAIVFIDEIDAVGRHRGAGLGGGHDEREQTLNQLLVEMDGFTTNEGVIVMAATNRRDILDPALLRPGRFDRQVTVNFPDLMGRVAILKVHAKGKPLAKDVDFENVAKRTPYATGADLENVMNEAAILAARARKKEISQLMLVEAIARVQMGPEKRSHKVNEKDRHMVAYHEAGHAIVAHELPNCDEVHLITIVPRGVAAGHTLALPSEERDNLSRNTLLDEICMILGGHAAEQVALDDIYTGSSSDLKRATELCRRMVTQFGMSDALGTIYLGSDQEVFVGMEFGHSREYSEEVASQIDKEVRRILEECYQKAVKVLSDNLEKLHNVAKALLSQETLSRNEFVALMSGLTLPIQEAAAVTEQPAQEPEEPESPHAPMPDMRRALTGDGGVKL